MHKFRDKEKRKNWLQSIVFDFNDNILFAYSMRETFARFIHINIIFRAILINILMNYSDTSCVYLKKKIIDNKSTEKMHLHHIIF